MKTRRITHLATLTLTIAAAAAPTAMGYAAPPQADAADGGQQPSITQNQVSPDARDAAGTASPAGAPDTLDERSPDAQDAADGRGTWQAPNVTVVRVPQVESVPSSTGLDWGDAGIGAGAMLGLTLVGLGGTLTVVHRRHRAPRPGRPAATA